MCAAKQRKNFFAVLLFCTNIKKVLHFFGSSSIDMRVSYRNPIVQVWQVDFSIVVDEYANFDGHFRRWGHVAHGGIVGVAVD